MNDVSVYSFDETDLTVKWKDDWLLEHEILDEQHKTIITLVNLLFDKEYSEIQKRISLPQTIDYMLHHLDTEEELLKKSQYSKKEYHLNLHDEFRQKAEQITSSVEKAQHISDDVLKFMKEWWVEHIVNEDVKLKPFLSKS